MIGSVRPSKGLHLFVGTPTKFKCYVYATLTVFLTIGSVKRYSGRGCVANDGDSLLAGLKLFHFVNVGAVHRYAFGIALLVFDMPARISDETARASSKLRNVALSKVIDKLIKRILRQLQS